MLIGLALLASCGEAGGEGAGNAFELTVEVRAGPQAPSGYGAEPGDALAEAQVEVQNNADPDGEPITGTTDESGRVTFQLKHGSYEVFATAKTQDELCEWIQGGSITLPGATATLTLGDMMVACQ